MTQETTNAADAAQTPMIAGAPQGRAAKLAAAENRIDRLEALSGGDGGRRQLFPGYKAHRKQAEVIAKSRTLGGAPCPR